MGYAERRESSDYTISQTASDSAAEAGTPSAAVKAHYYFDGYLHDRTILDDWITQSLRPFTSWNQTSLTMPCLSRALGELPEIKQHREIFFLGAWLGAVLEGQNTPEAQRAFSAWLSDPKIDHDLGGKVLRAWMHWIGHSLSVRRCSMNK